RPTTLLLRARRGLRDERLMTAVDAVEDADGDRKRNAGPSVEVSDHAHEADARASRELQQELAPRPVHQWVHAIALRRPPPSPPISRSVLSLPRMRAAPASNGSAPRASSRASPRL